MDQQWKDALFLHWRLPEAEAAHFMPPGVVPDVFDGSSWVGLIRFPHAEGRARRRSRDTLLRELQRDQCPPLLPGTGWHPRRGVPRAWTPTGCLWSWRPGRRDRPRRSRAGFRRSQIDDSIGFTVRRFRDGARSDFGAVPDLDTVAADPLSVHLTARFGLHTTVGRHTLYVPNTHAAWPLHRAEVTRLNDELISAAGINVSGPPDSVLFSPGVQTQFGRPRVLLP